MKESLLYTKSLAYAVRCVKFYDHYRGKGHYALVQQMLRSGTSIGANIRESRFAQSPSDFISKLSIALKEAEETIYWLEVMYQASAIDENIYQSMYHDNSELVALLVSTIKNIQKQYKTDLKNKQKNV